MAVGIFAVWIGLVAIVVAMVSYSVAMFRSLRVEAAVAGGSPAGAAEGRIARKKRGRADAPEGTEDRAAVPGPVRKPLLIGRRAFYLSCACVAVAAITLETLILNQRYEVFYIFKNSNAALPFFYRFASFWADQEGTFLLWGIYGSVLGLVFLRRASQDERWVMPFFCFVQTYLFVLMASMSAFKLHPLEGDLLKGMQMAGIAVPHGLWQKFVYMLGLAPVFPIRGGSGLNESLQNPWMVIHPPTLFVGYSSMVVPSCFAMAALVRRDYESWVNRAAPWLMFSWMVLGTGIFLGSYWAYETLGWGGYWAWDPVENSSLMPWLVGTALLHGLLAQRARGNFKQANLLLGILAFVAVLYGSFLTRSGVLEGMSVHSFASPGYAIYVSLLVVLGVWGLGGLALWIYRYRDIQSETAYDSVWERHFGLFLGIIVVSAIAAIVCACVSYPIFLKKTLPHTYYNRAILPVAFVLMLLMALTPLAPWRQVRERARLRSFDKAALLVAAGIVVAFIPAGICATLNSTKAGYGPALYVFAAAAVLSLVTNLEMLRRNWRTGLLNQGSWLSHIGFCVFLIGVILTSYYSEQRNLVVAEGDAGRAFGESFAYRGMWDPPKESRDHSAMIIEVGDGASRAELRPPLFVSQISKGSVMAWPRILHRWWGDLYVAPNGHGRGSTFTDLRPGAPSNAAQVSGRDGGTDTVQVQFFGHDVDRAALAEIREGKTPALTFWADVNLVVNGQVYPRLRPALQHRADADRQFIPAEVKTSEGRTYYVGLTQDNYSGDELEKRWQEGTGFLSVIRADAKDVGYFTVIHVPGIQLVWFGCYIMILGGFLTFRHRAHLARRIPPGNA